MSKVRLAGIIILCAVPYALPQSSTRPVSEKRFAERLGDMLKLDPELLRNVRGQRGFPPKMEPLKWLLGTWKEASGKMYKTPSTPERIGSYGGSFIYKTVPDSAWI